MACQIPDHPDPGDSYRSPSNFYLADPRRIASQERDLGLWWRIGLSGPSYRAAWVRETGELYAARRGMSNEQGEIYVLGHATDEELEDALEGWADICPQPDSMTWLCDRAMSLGQAETPRRLLREHRDLSLTEPAIATANVLDTRAATLPRRHINTKLLALVGTGAVITVPATALLFELSAI
jgi:hypothetical protein